MCPLVRNTHPEGMSLLPPGGTPVLRGPGCTADRLEVPTDCLQGVSCLDKSGSVISLCSIANFSDHCDLQTPDVCEQFFFVLFTALELFLFHLSVFPMTGPPAMYGQHWAECRVVL